MTKSNEQSYQKAKNHVDQLTQSILAKAFRGERVPQDPNDEPASVPLEHIPVQQKKETETAQKLTKQGEQQELEPIQLELPLY